MNAMDDRKIHFTEIHIDVTKIPVLIRVPVNNFLKKFIVINSVNCRMTINIG